MDPLPQVEDPADLAEQLGIALAGILSLTGDADVHGLTAMDIHAMYLVVHGEYLTKLMLSAMGMPARIVELESVLLGKPSDRNAQFPAELSLVPPDRTQP